MKTKDAIKWAGSRRKLAERLGISVQAVHKWGKEVPKLRHYEIAALQHMELVKANPPEVQDGGPVNHELSS